MRPPATDFWQAGIVPAPIATLLDPGALAALRERIVWLPDPGPWRYLADPFALRRGDTTHVFVEAFDYRTKHAVIEHHEFGPGLIWREKRTALARMFHLSYPYLIEHDGQVFMVPESQRHGEIALVLDEMSLIKAMEMGENGVSPAADDRVYSDAGPVYAEGILAFVGYMLSSRWSNLRSYKAKFTERDGALGVNRVLGALVDFDRWLDCPPRSSHEDQMRLHARLATISGGYMAPLIGYNPWTDVADNGKALTRVVQAVEDFKFVGAKIYPANGYRPWGNSAAQDGIGLPPHEKINDALKAFWDKCIELDIPVMAHTGESMGKDDDHDKLAAPLAWAALVGDYAKLGKSPRVNLGHFGGDTRGKANDWTKGMTEVMAHPGADKVFGDLGYWSELQCTVVGSERCEAAAHRLSSVLNCPVNGGGRVADRVMFGSDWLMLSREKNWAGYAAELFRTIKRIAPGEVEKIFGENARKCFGQRIG